MRLLTHVEVDLGLRSDELDEKKMRAVGNSGKQDAAARRTTELQPQRRQLQPHLLQLWHRPLGAQTNTGELARATVDLNPQCDTLPDHCERKKSQSTCEQTQSLLLRSQPEHARASVGVEERTPVMVVRGVLLPFDAVGSKTALESEALEPLRPLPGE